NPLQGLPDCQARYIDVCTRMGIECDKTEMAHRRERIDPGIEVRCTSTGIQDILDAPRLDVPDRRCHVLCVGRIDGMRRTELLGKRKPWRVHIDSDDGGRIRHLCRHDGGQADCTDAKDGDRATDRNLHRCQYRARPGLQTAAEWPEDLKWQVTWHLDGIALVGERIGRERGLSEEMGMQVLRPLRA